MSSISPAPQGEVGQSHLSRYRRHGTADSGRESAGPRLRHPPHAACCARAQSSSRQCASGGGSRVGAVLRQVARARTPAIHAARSDSTCSIGGRTMSTHTAVLGISWKRSGRVGTSAGFAFEGTQSPKNHDRIPASCAWKTLTHLVAATAAATAAAITDAEVSQ